MPQSAIRRFYASFDEYQSFFVTKTRSSVSQAQMYLRGLMQARRRNIERIRDVVPGADEQALHHFISNSLGIIVQFSIGSPVMPMRCLAGRKTRFY